MSSATNWNNALRVKMDVVMLNFSETQVVYLTWINNIFCFFFAAGICPEINHMSIQRI